VYAIGSKFALMGVRASDERNARVVLDVAYLPPGKGYGGEAGTAVNIIRELQDLIADQGGVVNGVCYDGALRGKHIDPLIKKGLTVLSPVHPTASACTPFRLVKHCSCGTDHQLVTQGGVVCTFLVTDTGERQVFSCPIKRLAKRHNVGSFTSHRWYQEVELDCCRTTMIRIDTTDDDRQSGYNRAERIRQHAPGSNVYKDCYGWREDTESWVYRKFRRTEDISARTEVFSVRAVIKCREFGRLWHPSASAARTASRTIRKA
jgi:hypothetical protein